MLCVRCRNWSGLSFWIIFMCIGFLDRKPRILVLRYYNFISRYFSDDWLILGLWCLRHILRFWWTWYRCISLFRSHCNDSWRFESSQSRGRSRLIDRAKIRLFLRSSILRIRWLKGYLLDQKIDCVVRCILVYYIAVLDRLWSLVFAFATVASWITIALSIAYVISACHFERLKN
jgi:hypothetical protein